MLKHCAQTCHKKILHFWEAGWKHFCDIIFYLLTIQNIYMNKLKLNQPWDEVKERLKEINGSLTDEDLVYEEGKEDVLLAHLSSKINMSTDDLKGLIESVSFNEGKAS